MFFLHDKVFKSIADGIKGKWSECFKCYSIVVILRRRIEEMEEELQKTERSFKNQVVINTVL